MDQTQNNQIRVQFQQIRKKHPQKLIDLQSKSSILQQCIRKFHISEFHKLYKKQISNLNINSNQKVIDRNDQQSDNIKMDQTDFNKNLLQSIKIIVQAYDKNQDIKEKYSYQNVTQMIDKTKLTFKQILKIKSQQQTKPKPNQNNKKIEQKNNMNQSIKQDLKKQNKIDSKNSQGSAHNNGHNTTIKQQTKVQPPKAKSNSLFVQKQAPISQQNIFKGQNNFKRPSSRLLNQKPQYLMGQKPKSSAKSNRSKRSKSSRGINDQKKSQKLSQSKLQVEQNLNNQLNYSNQKQETFENNNQNQQKHQSQNNNEDVREEEQLEESQKRQDKKIIFDQQTNFHLPGLRLSNQRPIRKKNPIQSILTNPYIKKAFNHLCKQNYLHGGRTFDDIAQSADVMTLNKWMVFCKQFDFISKLKKKQLVDIFQQCTQMKPQMNQKQFLDALIIVQSKMKVDQQDFIRKSMCLDSEFAFRQKVATFKVNYAGPKQNFFQQSSIKPLDKYYKSIQQQNYQKQREKQKQIILHQGKFRQQIQTQLKQRKDLRQNKKLNYLNQSVIQTRQNLNKIRGLSSIDKKINDNLTKSPYLKFVENKSNVKDNYSSVKNNYQLGLSKLYLDKRVQPMSYSQLFMQKNSISTRANTQKINSKADIIPQQKNMTQIKKPKVQQRTYIKMKTNQKEINYRTQERNQKQRSTPTKTTQKKQEKVQQTRPIRQWMDQIKNWAQQFSRSQSQQSDDILRQHLQNQKLKQKYLPKRMQLSRIINQYNKDQKQMQPMDNSEWDRQTELQTTINKQRFK